MYLFKQLQRVQNATASFVRKRYSKREDVIGLGWILMKERSDYSVAKLAWKSVNKPEWPKFLPMEKQVPLTRGTRSADNGTKIQLLEMDKKLLKQEYERQIQTLKLEHKIQLLEMDKKLLKQENDNKTKIFELQKEVQSLKHENEVMKLKNANDKMAADSNLHKHVAVKLDYKERLSQKEKEIADKEQKHKNDIIGIKDDMEKTIQALRTENENLKSKLDVKPGMQL